MDQYIGRLLDNRYEILEVLGTGGMAVVYKARCHRLNRLVAIKILKDEFAADEEFRRRFRAEGEAVAMLSHPNIVQVYDVSTSDSANFIVMELIDGISMKQYMEKKGILNWKETLHFAIQIAKGLEHAHSRGIVHRDIKPHNVMVLKNGSVKVMDFGIARVMNKSNTLTKEALGSVHYISPEQAKGGHTDNRTDLYSLGVVMYEMMTGRPPYDGESAVAVAIQHINGGAPKPSTLNPNIPVGMEQIIMKAMALELRDRYSSAGELLQEMEEFRKNPTIKFQHHFLIDDATQVISDVTQVLQGTAKKSDAVEQKERLPEKPRHRSSENKPRRDIASVRPNVDDEEILRPPKRSPIQNDRQRTERNRVVTTAIVICSGVAVIAIIVFLVALFNGALLNRERDQVEVPYLDGDLFDEGFRNKYSDFNIRTLPKEYNDVYRAGQIMYQQPPGGTKVQKGSDLWITVSMGPEPEIKKMDNFVNADAQEAYNLLKSQGYEPLTKKEPSEIYEEGRVTRTDPAFEEDVQEGQTVYVYISSGRSLVQEKMPNVVGIDVGRVKELMDQLGFVNVRYEQTESQRALDEVVYQSVAKDTLTDVKAEIIIQYSAGLQDPAAESTETDPAETEPEVTVTISFAVPSRPVEYRLEICLKDQHSILESKRVPPDATSTYVKLTGRGEMEYDLYIDGVYERTEKVNFDQWQIDTSDESSAP